MVQRNIKARVKHNMFDVLAGSNFRDETSEIITHLNSIGQKALLGMEREDGIYTIMGEDHIYYLTPERIAGQIPHKDFLKILHKNAMSLGKKAQFDYVPVNEKDVVWVKDAYTMNAMWNTIMMLDQIARATSETRAGK